MANGDVYQKIGGVWTLIDNIAGPPGASGANGTNGTVTLIGSQLLLSNTATVTFNSIPQTFNHLKLICMGRVTAANLTVNVTIQFNADTGANYDYEFIAASGTGLSSASTFAQTSGLVADWPGTTVTRSTMAGLFECIIPAYTQTSFEKVWTTTSGQSSGTATTGLTNLPIYGGWRSTAAITRIDILCPSGNLATGSFFSLYGL